MENSHPIADGIARPGSAGSRVLRLAALVLLAAAAMAGVGAQSAFAAAPVTVTFSVSPTAVPLGGAVTMTATVTSPLGPPDGSISFVSAAPAPVYDSHQQVLNPTTDPNTKTATFTASNIPSGTYAIRALYTPSYAASLLGLGTTYSTTSQALMVGTTTTPLRPTQTILSAPTTVDSTTNVTLTATVSEIPAGAPPTGAVQFVDLESGSPIELRPSPVPLINGVAQLVTTLAVGPHKILASYTGGGGYAPSSSQPPLLINSVPPVDPYVRTDATVVVSPSPIASGDVATITARIVQDTAAGLRPATGGRVIFTAKKDDGYLVNLGSAALGTSPSGAAAVNEAVIQNSTLQPGNYTIIADYAGNLFGFHDSAAEVALSVLPPRAATDITYTGNSTVGFGQSATLSAIIRGHGGGPLAGRSVTFTLGGQSCESTTAADGSASCSIVATPAIAVTSVTIAVAEDVQTLPATLPVPFTVTSTVTSLTYSGTTTAPYHGTPTLSATLAGAGGVPVPGRVVTFALGTQRCTGTTNAAGVVSCSFGALTQNAGPYTVSLGYAGDAYTTQAATTAPFSVTPAPTTLVATAPTAAVGTMTLTATLTETASGALLSGKTVTLSLGTSASTCTATTVAGVATCPVPTPPGTTATFTATFAGDTNYLGQVDTRTVTLLRPTRTIYTGALTGDYHDPVTLSAKVLEVGTGAPVSGKAITLQLGSQSCSPAPTDASGVASCTIPSINQAPGSSSVVATFAAQAIYLESSATQTFTITREETTVVAPSGPLLRGSTVTLTGKLLEDGVTPIAGGVLTLTLGAQPPCSTGPTNAGGIASCTVPGTAPLGVTATSAGFAGNDSYLPASSTAPGSVLLYAFAPGGGAFVVGDLSATLSATPGATVTFWGSKWAKVNRLSGGEAPDSFKGYAASGATQCGSGWTSAPGKSSDPPETPLPAYMAVLVTNRVTKTGSTVSGTTAHIVIVQTSSLSKAKDKQKEKDRDDEKDKFELGKAGTGTVVATVC